MTPTAEKMKGIPPHGREAIVKLLLTIAARGVDLTEEEVAKVEAISIYGVDPDWQTAELEKIAAELERRNYVVLMKRNHGDL